MSHFPSLSSLLLFTVHDFYFALVCCTLPFSICFLTKFFLSHSTVFNISTIQNDVYPVSFVRRVSFHGNQFYLLIKRFERSEFCHKFHSRSTFLNIFQVVRWIVSSSVTPVVEIREISGIKFEKRKALVAFKSMSGSAESRVLRELRSEQVRQVLKTTLSNGIMGDSDPRVPDIFRIVFRTKDLSLTYIIARSSIQLHLWRHKKHSFKSFKCATSFQDALLHSLFRDRISAEEVPAGRKTVSSCRDHPC